jgi:hypothetical protein
MIHALTSFSDFLSLPSSSPLHHVHPRPRGRCSAPTILQADRRKRQIPTVQCRPRLGGGTPQRLRASGSPSTPSRPLPGHARQQRPVPSVAPSRPVDVGVRPPPPTPRVSWRLAVPPGGATTHRRCTAASCSTATPLLSLVSLAAATPGWHWGWGEGVRRKLPEPALSETALLAVRPPASL